MQNDDNQEIMIEAQDVMVEDTPQKDTRIAELCRYVGAVIAIAFGMCAVAVLITLTIKLILWIVGL